MAIATRRASRDTGQHGAFAQAIWRENNRRPCDFTSLLIAAIAANCPISLQVGLIALFKISAASKNSSAKTSQLAKPRKTTSGSIGFFVRTSDTTPSLIAWAAPITITTTAMNSLQVATTAAMSFTISNITALFGVKAIGTGYAARHQFMGLTDRPGPLDPGCEQSIANKTIAPTTGPNAPNRNSPPVAPRDHGNSYRCAHLIMNV